MKMTKPILSIILLFITLSSFSQQGADSIRVIPRDVIIKTNGNMFQCSIIEVNDTAIKYKTPAGDTAAIIQSVARGDVYAISYNNGVAMVITPELMGKKAGIYPEQECESLKTFRKNLGSGAINVGFGLVDFYSPLKNVSSYEDTKVMPSAFVGYTFKFNKWLKAGVHIGVGGNNLTKSGESQYDQVKISAEIDERFICLGLFARYDFLKGIFKPYVKAGVDFIGVNMVTTSESTSMTGSESSLKTVVHQSGIKPALILRAGMDLYFGEKFGIYGDVGTGLSLVQIGLLFNLE
jgi:hypothetical protein